MSTAAHRRDSRGTHRVLNGQPKGTQGVLTGYSMGNLRVLKPARVAGESAAHRRVCSDLGCGRSARHARRSEGERLWRTQCVPIDRTLRESLPWARPSRTRGRRGVSAPPLRAKTGAPAAARPPSVTLPPPRKACPIDRLLPTRCTPPRPACVLRHRIAEANAEA